MTVSLSQLTLEADLLEYKPSILLAGPFPFHIFIIFLIWTLVVKLHDNEVDSTFLLPSCSSVEYGEGNLIFVITFNRLLPLSNAAL